MSTRVPTDSFGRSLDLRRLPFTTIRSAPTIDYDSLYINTEGDKMTGTLNMNRNKITNIQAPTKPLDATNKAYVDLIQSKVYESISNHFETSVKEVGKKIKKNRDQDLALKNLIKGLQTQISRTRVVVIRSKLANTKNISTLIIPWKKGNSITRNVVVLQALIQADNDCWLDIYSLGYQYGLHMYDKFNKKSREYELHISATQTLPSQWKRNILIFCRTIQ